MASPPPLSVQAVKCPEHEKRLSRSLKRVIVAKRMRARLASNAKMDEIDIVAIGSAIQKNRKAV